MLTETAFNPVFVVVWSKLGALCISSASWLFFFNPKWGNFFETFLGELKRGSLTASWKLSSKRSFNGELLLALSDYSIDWSLRILFRAAI